MDQFYWIPFILAFIGLVAFAQTGERHARKIGLAFLLAAGVTVLGYRSAVNKYLDQAGMRVVHNRLNGTYTYYMPHDRVHQYPLMILREPVYPR